MTAFGIGQPVRRVEDKRFLTGSGRFIDDINLLRQAHAAVVLSPHAHARIKRIEIARAQSAPGVICVLTGADVLADELGGIPPLYMPQDRGWPPGYRTLRPLLVHDRVRCVGDRIAFVVAETPDAARDAAELIEIDFEPLSAVVDLDHAVAADAPLLWEDCPTGNVCFALDEGDKAATDAAFAKARHVVSLRLANNRISANPIEPRGGIGAYDAADDFYTLYTSSQNPHGLRSLLARAIFRLPESKFRIIAPDVGGSFGMKSNAHPEDALLLWASRRCRRPVKWIASRSESLVGDSQARDQIVQGEMALDASGKILGLRARALHGLGAYIYAAGLVPPTMFLRLVPNLYDFQALHLEIKGVFTNTATLTSYRGAGRPEAAYLIERLLDRAAAVIGIAPVELRRRNFIRPEAMPYRSATGVVYDSGEFARVMEKCLDLAEWSGFAVRRDKTGRQGRLRGRGISCYIEQGGNFNERMELRFDPSGAVTILAGTHSHGQGHATTYAQLVAQWLGVDFAAIRFIQGDTDKVSFGRGTFAARSSLVGGCALKLAAEAILVKAQAMAALLLEAAPADIEFSDGIFRIAGTDRAIALVEVAKAFYLPVGISDKFGAGLEASAFYATNPHNHPNGCHTCEVEIDPETGKVVIDRYTVVDDVGRIINPLICEGQVHGGVAQGVGQALTEHIIYDRQSGQLLTGSFMDYGMPRADDFPPLVTGFEEITCTTNPLGIKGIGEAGAIGAPPAVINAVIDALRPLGVDHLDMPATPERVWQAIRQAQSRGV